MIASGDCSLSRYAIRTDLRDWHSLLRNAAVVSSSNGKCNLHDVVSMRRAIGMAFPPARRENVGHVRLKQAAALRRRYLKTIRQAFLNAGHRFNG
jgi:hypothetical protein